MLDLVGQLTAGFGCSAVWHGIDIPSAAAAAQV
jgi:hypothetical protein